MPLLVYLLMDLFLLASRTVRERRPGSVIHGFYSKGMRAKLVCSFRVKLSHSIIRVQKDD